MPDTDHDGRILFENDDAIQKSYLDSLKGTGAPVTLTINPAARAEDEYWQVEKDRRAANRRNWLACAAALLLLMLAILGGVIVS